MKWSSTNYVKVYVYARQGMTQSQIADALGVSHSTLKGWFAQRPALRDAWDEGRDQGEANADFSFRDYVYKRLPPALQDLWNEINAIEEESNDIARMEAVLTRHGKRARQHLFLYALTASNFNVSLACRKVNISRNMFKIWVADEPAFAALMDEIHEHKKDFLENAFLRRCAAGDTPAIIHGVKSLCRDRGYNPSIDVQVQQQINVNVTQQTINVLELDLPLETRKVLLQAIRDARTAQEQTPTAPQRVLEVQTA